jgi:hypothetical protein
MWLTQAMEFTKDVVWVLLARGEPPESPGWTLETSVDYEWPLTSVPRRAIRYRRVSV